MGFARSVRTYLATAVVAAAATAAWAQDYTVTQSSGQWISPPANAVDLGLTGDDSGYLMSGNTPWTNAAFPPFPISYYGTTFTTASQFGIMCNGYIQLGGATGSGCCSPSAGPFPSGNTYDGQIALAWDDLHSGTGGGKIYAWVNGSAPNRRFIIAYVNWSPYNSQANGTLNFQVQFSESSGTNPGRIVIAYTGGWTTYYHGYAVHLDEYSGAGRFIRPPASGSTSGLYTFTASPVDWIFDPKVTTFTGRALYDRLVADASGIGNTVEQGLPLNGLRVDLLNASGGTVGTGTVDASGNYAVAGLALIPTASGSIALTSQGASGVVSTSVGGAPYRFTLASGVSFASNNSFGTVTLGSGNDPTGSTRAPFNIARTVQGVYDWCATRTTDTIKQVNVLYDTASTATTSYTSSSLSLRVSALASNLDAWDNAVIRKNYARHILGSIAANPSTSYNSTFDVVSDQENAFAEGFGYYLNAVISGDTQYVDALTASTATVLNLESPTLTSAKGPDVAGWVAAALYDLVDPANEAFDTFDGTGAPGEQVFRTVDAIKVPVNASNFYTAWGQTKGYDGVPLATLFIRNGLIGDDGDEPNDAAGQSFTMTQFGFIRTARILNLYNEDWYRFTMPQPTNKLTADVIYNRVTYNTNVSLEIKDSNSNTVATGAYIGTAGNLHAESGALPAGDYFLRVKHLGNNRLDSYSLQVFSELAFSSPEFAPWTVGRSMNLPMNIKGGIPPYTLGVEAPFSIPPGVILDGATLRVKGVPSQAGLFNFMLSGKDSASPQNIASGPVSFRVNPEFKFRLGEFQAFAYDKNWDRVVATNGGTAPYTFSIDEGALPHGLVMTSGAKLRYAGRPDAPGSFFFKVTGTDTAGSFDTAQSVGVTCVPFGTATLGVANAACGYWFDAVEGSAVSIKIKTTPGHVARAIRVKMLDVDGNTEVPANIRAGKGGASVNGFVAPSTGRFYCVIAGDDAGGNTSLNATAKITAPKKGGGNNGEDNFVPGEKFAVNVGALQGATVTFSAKPDRSGMVMKSYYLVNPLGQVVTFAPGQVKFRGGAVTFSAKLDVTGTWQVILGAEPGAQGHFTYSFKLKQPAGVTYSGG